MVNMAKSELIFSKKVPNDIRSEISQILPMQRVDNFSKYLGIPTTIGRSKQQVFNYLSDRIWKNSKAGRRKIYLLQAEGP
jgi:hypothetical protein